MKKKYPFFSVILICLYLLMTFANAAAADPLLGYSDSVDAWDGISTKEPTETISIDGKTYYCITSCAELAYIAENDQNGITYRNINLEADLVWNTTLPEYGADGTCLNSESLHAFKGLGRITGDFRGNGHTMVGLYMNRLDYQTAFIQELRGTVSNLHFADSCIIGSPYAAGICGAMQAYSETCAIRNCSFSGSVYGGTGCGGIVGKVWANGETDYTHPETYPTVLIENCTFSGSVNGTDFYTGGIVGTVDGKWATVKILNCENYGAVHGNKYVGGINGYLNNVADLTVQIVGCVNYGAINASVTSGAGIAGGLSGVGSTTCSNCANFGSVSAAIYAAGLIADISTRDNYGINEYYQDKNVRPGRFLIQSCFSMGELSGENVGGLIAVISIQDSGTVTIQDSFFCGTINTRFRAGTLIATIGNYGDGSLLTQNCYAAGSVLGQSVLAQSIGAIGLEYKKQEQMEFATVSFSGCKWLKSMAGGFWGVQPDGESPTLNGCSALSIDELSSQASFPEFDFDRVWTQDASSGYPFPLLTEACAGLDLQTPFQNIAANVSIEEVGKTAVRTNLDLLCGFRIVVAIYRADGKMVDIVSEELSAGSYPRHDFALHHSLSVGDRVAVFGLTPTGFCASRAPVGLTIEQDPPEKLYTAYLELDAFGHLYARINSSIVPAEYNSVLIRYKFDNEAYSWSSDGYSKTGDVGYDLTDEFAYCAPCRINAVTLTHRVNNQVIAEASIPVSISVEEGTGTPISITEIQTEIIQNGDYSDVWYEFTTDQPLNPDKSYSITYQNESVFSHSNKLARASIQNGKLVCCMDREYNFPGTGHFWVTATETISMESDGSVTITCLPKGIGYRFDNDSLTAM